MWWIEVVLQFMAILFVVALFKSVLLWQMWLLVPPKENRNRIYSIIQRALFFAQPLIASSLVGVFIYVFYYMAGDAWANNDFNMAIIAGVFLGFSIFSWFLLLWHPFSKLASGAASLAFARVRPLVNKKS